MGSVVVVSSVLASGSLVLLGVEWLGHRSPGERVGAAAVCVLAYAAVLWTRSASVFVSDAMVLAVAVALAPLLGRSLGSAGAIVAFTVTAAVVDLLSFGGGLTRQIIQDYQSGGDDLLRYLAVTIPMGGRETPLVGVVDLVILGALFHGLVKIHHRRARAAVTMLGALALAVATGIRMGGVAAVPFLGLAAVGDAWLAAWRQGKIEGRRKA